MEELLLENTRLKNDIRSYKAKLKFLHSKINELSTLSKLNYTKENFNYITPDKSSKLSFRAVPKLNLNNIFNEMVLIYLIY